MPVTILFVELPRGEMLMAITVGAVYENGVLKLDERLPLAEHQKVMVTIQPASNWVQETAGIIGWKGTHEELKRFVLDPEFDPEESA
jgi:predicted DNA-binding antitoxin AbrB/MazE fold protein